MHVSVYEDPLTTALWQSSQTVAKRRGLRHVDSGEVAAAICNAVIGTTTVVSAADALGVNRRTLADAVASARELTARALTSADGPEHHAIRASEMTLLVWDQGRAIRPEEGDPILRYAERLLVDLAAAQERTARACDRIALAHARRQEAALRGRLVRYVVDRPWPALWRRMTTILAVPPLDRPHCGGDRQLAQVAWQAVLKHRLPDEQAMLGRIRALAADRQYRHDEDSQEPDEWLARIELGLRSGASEAELAALAARMHVAETKAEQKVLRRTAPLPPGMQV